MPLKLGKPPVVEAWIEFRFNVNEETPWTEAIAHDFLDTALGGRYKVRDFVGRADVVFDTQGGTPSVKEAKLLFERIRAVGGEHQDRYIQVGRGALVVNLCKVNEWAGFNALSQEAMEAFGKFRDFFKPHALNAAAIHYRDVVEIPWPDDRQLELRDYMELYMEIPADRFGQTSSFNMSCSLVNTAVDGVLTIAVRREQPPDTDSQQRPLRLVMDWNITTRPSVASLDADNITAWLQNAHNEIEKVFRHAFTDKGWALFQPME